MNELKITNSVLLPHDAHALRGIATVSRPSVRLSVTLMYHSHISGVSLKVVIQLISLRSSLLGALTLAI